MDDAALLNLARRGATVLEIRIDSFDSTGQGLAYLKELKSRFGQQFGLLATCRETEETRPDRAAVFQAAAGIAHAIDIEFESPDREALVQMGHAAGCRVFLSSHNFEKTPAQNELLRILEESRRLNCEACKIAVYANDMRDMQRLSHFLLTHFDDHLITIAMGPNGLSSRIMHPVLGSLVSYGYLEKPNAPGQLSLDELHETMMKFHPGYAQDYANRFP